MLNCVLVNAQDSISSSIHPKLLVGIVVDQMRYDYLFRYWDKLGDGGFKKMIQNGYLFKNANYSYVPTYTAPGHATIYAGCTPSQHGIVANEWYDESFKVKRYCVADKRFNSIDMIRIDNPSLEGIHNSKNAMAAATIAQLVNIRKQTIRDSLQTFKGAPHRLEKVLSILKVDYINDSKATNVNATYYALESMTRPTIWIVGGVDKGNDYTKLLPLVRKNVKAIICLGLNNETIIDCFSPVVNLLIEAGSMFEAVQASYDLAKKGDTVLLSPACASFDLFENYEDRGNQFKQLVRKL